MPVLPFDHDDGTETGPDDGTPPPGGQHDPRAPSGSPAPPATGTEHDRDGGETAGPETGCRSGTDHVDDDEIVGHIIPLSHVDTDGIWRENLTLPCRALLSSTREVLLSFEARGATPSLRACGMHPELD